MAWIIFGIIFSVLTVIQTLRLIDKDRTITSLRNCEANLLWQRDSYYQKLQDMTVSRDSYADLYTDACEAIKDGNEKISRLSTRISVLESDLRDEEASSGQLLEDKAKVIQELQDRISILSRTRECVSVGHLQSGLTCLMRFVAANQWMMENDMVFAEAVASVSEVAEAITERED
jgi:hypothetical protein